MGFFTKAVIAATLGIIIYAVFIQQDTQAPGLPDGYWGRGEPKPDLDTSIRKFKINSSKEMITDLHSRLRNVRLGEDLENTEFQYGFQVKAMRPIIKYWLETYEWEKHVERLNSFPHFKTRIEGIDIHFIHVKPAKREQQKDVRPILLTHGWPSSMFDFHKLIPLLAEGSMPLEVICPSIPGFGFSEAPHQPGLDNTDTARIWTKLMTRLGHEKFYAHGGDWGAGISEILAQVYPERILGFHSVMFAVPLTLESAFKQLVAAVAPSLVFHPDDVPNYRSMLSQFLFLLGETGYMHIQATKPDTVAFALNDSPVGLAAYILEKFSSGLDPYRNPDLPDGGLPGKFTWDDLLTNVMIYWVNGNIGSSMRFYKEVLTRDDLLIFDKVPVQVRTGLAVFPREIVTVPEALAKIKFRNIKQFTCMPRGGHFAALEEPKLLAEDIISFVQKVENDL